MVEKQCKSKPLQKFILSVTLKFVYWHFFFLWHWFLIIVRKENLRSPIQLCFFGKQECLKPDYRMTNMVVSSKYLFTKKTCPSHPTSLPVGYRFLFICNHLLLTVIIVSIQGQNDTIIKNSKLWLKCYNPAVLIWSLKQ